MRIWLIRWLRSMRGKFKESEGFCASGDSTSEVLTRTGEEDASSSLSVALDGQAHPPDDGATSLSRRGTDISGPLDGNAQPKRPSNIGIPSALSPQVETTHQAVSSTAPRLSAASRAQPQMSTSVLPKLPPVRQQPHDPVQRSTPARSSLSQEPPVSDTTTPFSPQYTAYADSRQSVASISSSNSPSDLRSDQYDLEPGSARDLMNEEMDFDALFRMPQDVGKTIAPQTPGHRDFDVNDRIISLSAGLNLRSISEAWMTGLRSGA